LKEVTKSYIQKSYFIKLPLSELNSIFACKYMFLMDSGQWL